MKNFPVSSMPISRKLQSYFKRGESHYAQFSLATEYEVTDCLPLPELLLQCTLHTRIDAVYPSHHLRLKQRFLAIAVILEGSELVRIDSRCFLAEAGDILLMRPGCDVEFAIPKGGHCRKIGIVMFGRILELAVAHSGWSNLDCISGVNPEALLDNLGRLREALNMAGRNGGICCEILQQLSDLAGQQREPEELRKMRLYVAGQLAGDLRVPRLAEICGVSIAQLRILTRRFWNCAPHEYVRRYRMSIARHLLVCGEYSVKEVAGLVGYRNALNFSTEFRRLHGMSPKHYVAEY